MAVQAHCSPNTFMPDFRKRSRDALLANLQQYNDPSSRNVFLGGGFNFNYRSQNLIGNTVFSELGSELTCNLSTTEKRRRIESEQIMNVLTPEQQLRLLVSTSSSIGMPRIKEKSTTMTANMISTGLHLTHQEARLNQSGTASTSCTAGQDPISYLYRRKIEEIDELVRLHNERLRLALEEKRKSHHAAVMALLEVTVSKKLREKETELQNARMRNAELEEKVKQMAVESQIWQNVARNGEAMAENLKSSLEKVLLFRGATAGQQIRPEGYGDSDVPPAAVDLVVDDAQSGCVCEVGGDGDTAAQVVAAATTENGEHLRTDGSLCRVCRKCETTVLLLPCRHLCLCKECDSRHVSCPVCNAHKSASLQVYIS